MPLDARKTQHILDVVPKTYAGRQRTVVFVSLVSSVYSYTTVQVIMRPLEVIDPQIYDASGKSSQRNADSVMIAPLATTFAGVVFVADTTTATAMAVAAAPKYEIIEALADGVVPGGSHFRVLLRRLR